MDGGLLMLKRMSFYHQVFLIILTGYLIAMVGLFLFTSKSRITFETHLGEELKQEILQAAERQVKSESDRLDALALSHGHWTDLVDKTSVQDEEWIRDNATQYLLENPAYAVDEVYLKNFDNSYVERYGVLPEKDLEQVTRQHQLYGGSTIQTSYLVPYEGMLYLLSATDLALNDGTGSRGIYIVGHRIDEHLLKTLQEIFSSRADVRVSILRTKATRIVNLDLISFTTLLVNDLRIEVGEIKMIEGFSQQMKQFFNWVIAFSIPAVLVILYLMNLLSRSVQKSINKVTDITYRDYGERISGGFSREFIILEECINRLADNLEDRDSSIRKKYAEIVSLLIKTLEEVDVYTKGHSERVSQYALDLAKAVDYEDLEAIRLGGLMHDLGKVSIDSAILNKPGKLNPEEFAAIQTHPVVGAKILEHSEVFSNVTDIVRFHHEKLDGSGYPDGLLGDEIPMGARILAIADTFDALTSERSYRSPLDVDQALEIILRDTGTHFDPYLTRVFKTIAVQSYEQWSKVIETPTVEELS